MSKHVDEEAKQAQIREAKEQGMSASEAGLSTGAGKQIGHGDEDASLEQLHAEKGKS